MNINHKPKFSTDIIAHEVRKFWYNTYPQTVVVFFYQSYDGIEWEWCEEVACCQSFDDYINVIFINDFCEGQTKVKNIHIIPLWDITHYYGVNKIRRKEVKK